MEDKSTKSDIPTSNKVRINLPESPSSKDPTSKNSDDRSANSDSTNRPTKMHYAYRISPYAVLRSSKTRPPNSSFWKQEMIHLEADSPGEIHARVERLISAQKASGIKVVQARSSKLWKIVALQIKAVAILTKFKTALQPKAIEYAENGKSKT